MTTDRCRCVATISGCQCDRLSTGDDGLCDQCRRMRCYEPREVTTFVVPLPARTRTGGET